MTESYYWVTTRLLRESGPWYSPPITGPNAVASLVNDHLDLQNADREYFLVICLDCKNMVSAIQIISVGSLNTCLVHPREVYKPVLLASANAAIIVHNHPSGDPNPSPQDIEITRQLTEAGKILGIELIDHIIIGYQKYWSMREMGQL